MKFVCFILSLCFVPLAIAGEANQVQKQESLCPDSKMISIPQGEFIMGSDELEKEFAYQLDGGITRKYRWYDIETKRTVKLGEYCIDQTLVTSEEYLKFVRKKNWAFPYISPQEYQKQGFLVHPYTEVEPFLWSHQGYPKGLDKHPVVLVSLDDASKYCEWRGNRFKKKFNLPTEEEWEKAARGTEGRYFPWGNEWEPSKLNSGSSKANFTTKVDQYPSGKSPFGLFDAVGNVFEWTLSKFPNGKSVLKSCSWDDYPGICRPAARHGRPPQSRHILFGFRCVMEH